MAALTETGVTMLERHPADSAAAVDAITRAMSFPEHQPPIQGSRSSADGSLWLRREDVGGPTFRWTVLGPEDEPTGEVAIAREARVVWIGGGTVWTGERDSLAVPWLVRHRLGGR